MTTIRTVEFDAYVTYLKEADEAAVHPFASATISVNIEGLRDMIPQYRAAVKALDAWHVSTGLTFVLSTDPNAQIVMDNEEAGSAYATNTYGGDGFTTSAFINVAKDWMDEFPVSQQWGTGTYGLQTFTHEVGHALGLNHGGPYDGDGDYETDGIFYIDTNQYSIMSYFDQSNYRGATDLYLYSPMIADVTAIRELYGKIAVNTGNTTYGRGEKALGGISDLSKFPNSAYTIVDDGGTDIIDLRGGTKASILDLRPGRFSDINGNKGNLAIDFKTTIENAFGTSAGDKLIGNNVANKLNGLTGDDQLFGHGGNDRLTGGLGNDVFDGGAGKDVFIFAAKAGTDRIVHFQDRFDKIGFTSSSIDFSDLDIGFKGGSTIVDYGSGSITLVGIKDSLINKADFLFDFA